MEHTELLQKQLIERCKKGDSKAEFALFQQYVKQMYNVAFRITGNKLDAEDAVQESFIKAFSKISSFKGEATFGAWLKRIVVNKCIEDIRKRKVFFESIQEDTLNTKIAEVDVFVEAEQDIIQVMKAIEELPDGARVVFTLKAIEEYRFKEISEMLNLSESNCKVQYHRSKKLLREKLKNKVFVN